MPSLYDFYLNRRCLVTGGRGFIGRNLVAALESRGAVVEVFDRPPEVDRAVVGDGVAHLDTVRAQFLSFQPELVFHLAAQTEVRLGQTEPQRTFATNVVGTFNVLECCRLGGVAVVVASSDKAYGQWPSDQLPYREDGPLRSGDFYAGTKRAADQLSTDYARLFQLPVRVLRCANVYGPGQTNLTTLIASAVRAGLSGQRPQIHDGCQRVLREWLFVGDAVMAYLQLGADTATKYDDPTRWVYNVGSKHAWSIQHTVQEVLRQCGRNPEDYDVVPSPVGVQIGDQFLDSTRYRQTFRQHDWMSFSDGIRHTVAWQKAELERSVPTNRP